MVLRVIHSVVVHVADVETPIIIHDFGGGQEWEIEGSVATVLQYVNPVPKSRVFVGER